MTELIEARPARGQIIPSADGSPLVSVIVALYNDPLNLPTAVRSVLSQTLHDVEVLIVDDCSSDNSREIAENLANEDERVRVYSTTENSGGPGAPRNVGLDHARGRYLMFVDSDDELERHACANIVRVGDRDRSDLIMGQTRRLNVAKDRESGWYARLYSEERTLNSIEEFPDLVRDTIIAKAVRRSFFEAHKLRFPERVHYEDMPVSAAMQRLAERITVIPEVIYYWKIYASDMRKSITNSREAVYSLDHRIESLTRVISEIDPNENPLFLRALYEKIVVHDVRLYITDISEGTNDELAREVLSRLSVLLQTIPDEVLDGMDFQRRLSIAAVLSQDPDLVRSAARMLRGDSDLDGTFTSNGDKLFWEEQKLNSLNVSEHVRALATGSVSEHRSIPWFNVKFSHRLDTIERTSDGRSLILTGVTADGLHQLADVPGLHWQLRLIERTGLRRQWTFPIHTDWLEHDAQHAWKTSVSLPPHVDLTSLPRMTLRIDMTTDNVAHTSGILISRKLKSNKLRISPAGRLSSLFNAKYQPYVTIAKTLALRPARVGKRRKQLRNALTPVSALQGWMLGLRAKPAEDPYSLLARGAYAALRMLPLRNRVLIESQMGQADAGSPGAIAAVLAANGQNLVWSASSMSRPVWSAGRDDVVFRGTWSYIYRLATSRYIVDDQSFPDYFRKRSGQVYVQTWHGIPLKKMGLDQPEFEYAQLKTVNQFKRRSSYWDYLTIPSEYFRRVFVPAFATSAKQLPVGTPRNDVLANSTATSTAAARKALGLDPDRKIVLYAPTFRDGERGNTDLKLDLQQWVEEMADDFQLLVRPHYLNRIKIPRDLRPHIVDTTKVDDVNQLLQAADILITDYSSIMFDYLALDRPEVLYTYDLDLYEKSLRGTYFDLREHAPGPLAMDQESLMKHIRSAMRNDEYSDQRSAFQSKFAGSEPGDATVRTVAEVWGL